MKITFLAKLLAFMILTLTGCGSDSNNSESPPLLATKALSDATIDGYITLHSGGLTIAQGTSTNFGVFAGTDPVNGNEYRAFLNFPVTGIPGDATIDSAFIDIVISRIIPLQYLGMFPVTIDLVSFQPPLLVEKNFDRTTQPALATIAPTLRISSNGQRVIITVTSLMSKAQQLGLSNFQIRIMKSFDTASSGLIEINDTTGVNRSSLAPQLTVRYF